MKFPLREALEAFGLYVHHATQAIKPMSKEVRDEIGLACQAQLETGLVALRNKLSEAGLDVYLAKHGATASTSSR